MKVAIINFSGNVGKTTVAAHLLKPRMGDARVFSVESLNVDASADGLEVERLKGKQFAELTSELMLIDNAIIDVGASNAEDFIKALDKFAGSHIEFDYFVVPVTREQKVLADTVNTLAALQKIGVPKSKIRVVFNKADADDQVEDAFAPIFGYHEQSKGFMLNAQAVIFQNEVFEMLKEIGKTLGDVVADDTDYRGQLKTASSEDEKIQLVRMVQIKRLAVGANEGLDRVFKVLFK